MTVTDVKVKIINGEKAVRAVTDVVFDGVLVIHGVKVVEGKSGIFISFPQRSVRDRKAKETSYFDIVHPLNTQTRHMIEEAILDAYNKAK